uniref:Uncharacterized protein n=1 Tax=Brassica oleracea TaxID=3712 RepID=A0A3P6EUK5_BRAOL|nr:unnamed protein product [Brassica oleracea]
MEGVVSRVVYGPCCYNTGGLPLCDLLFKTLILHPDCVGIPSLSLGFASLGDFYWRSFTSQYHVVLELFPVLMQSPLEPVFLFCLRSWFLGYMPVRLASWRVVASCVVGFQYLPLFASQAIFSLYELDDFIENELHWKRHMKTPISEEKCESLLR